MRSWPTKCTSGHWRFCQMLITFGVGQSVTDERNCVRVLVSVPSATWIDFRDQNVERYKPENQWKRASLRTGTPFS